MKTRNPSHHTPWLLPAVKNAFLTEAKTVKTGTKFIIRDTAQQVGEHTGKQFVQLRQKQGRDAHPERKGVGVLPNKEERSKEAVKSLIQGSSSGSLFTSGQLSGFFLRTCPALGPSLTRVRNFFPRWIPAQRPMGWP